ncbi:MAG: general secretion pathway protein GspK [Candidatus Omnitrophica bacterium]|nr:general secretion pathway protein GspK [Candidatus Omnitrophota bacterium]
MNNKGQVLMISLWVLIILALLAVNLGHEVSLDLRVGRYHVDKLKAYALAKAGLNSAVVELDNDKNDYDALTERWSTGMEAGKPIFQKKEIRSGSGEDFTVGELSSDGTYECIIDEERKININTASLGLLSAFLEDAGVANARSVANSIRAFRGATDISFSEQSSHPQGGQGFKGQDFVNAEELILVDGMTEEAVKNLSLKATVFGDGLININTVSAETLKIFLRGIARDISVADNFADQLTDKVVKDRNTVGAYKSVRDINVMVSTEEETNIFNRFVNRIVFKSNNFLINVTGEAGVTKTRLAAIYEKKNKKIVFWHEEG